MKKEIVLDRLLKSVIIATVVLIGLQYYFYRLREDKIQREYQQYVAKKEFDQAMSH